MSSRTTNSPIKKKEVEMTYSTVKEVITAAGLDPLLTYTPNNGMEYTDITAEQWTGASSKGKPLTVASLSKTIQISPKVYGTPGQLEIFKSNLIFELASDIISSFFVTTSGVDANAVLPMLENAVLEEKEATTAAGAADALLSVGLVDSFKIFNGNKAVALEYSGTTYNTLFDESLTIAKENLIALEAVPGAYMVYLSDIEFTIDKQLHNNKIFITGEVLVQAMPTMPVYTAVTA